MVKKLATVVCLLAAVSLAGCDSRTDRSESGTILSITDFDGLPLRASVNDLGGILLLEEITLSAIPTDPGAPTSTLMDVEMRSYQVTYRRLDAGTVTPPPLVQNVFGVAPINGTIVYDNLVIMGAEQLTNPPLSNLLFENGGIDPETGEQFVRIRFEIRFFGRTLTGNSVASNVASFDVELVP